MTCEFRVERAASDLPQTAQSALFTVSGGKVLVVGLVGEVTTATENVGGAYLKIVSNPTTGNDRDLCINNDIHNRPVGDFKGLTGVFSEALTSGGAAVWASQPVVIPPGTLDWLTSESITGQMKWTLFYRPLDPGAKVEAA